MGKKKRASAGRLLHGTIPQAEQHEIAVSPCSLPLGQPLLIGRLVSIGAPVAPPGVCLVSLAPADFHTARLVPAKPLLVGYAHAACTGTSSGSGGQAALRTTENAAPVPLWPGMLAATGGSQHSDARMVNLPGHFVKAASAIPSAALAGGEVGLSATLNDSLGQPLPGSAIIMYQISGSEPHQGSAEGLLATSKCSAICLRLCMDAQSGLPMALPKPRVAHPSELLPGQASPILGRPAKERISRAAPEPMSQAGGDWVLRMLAELSGGGERAGQQRHLLHLLAHAHLQGRHLLLGNPVPLPLLGRLCIFQVVQLTPAQDSDVLTVFTVGPATSVTLISATDSPPEPQDDAQAELSAATQLEQQKTDSIEEVIQGACESLDEHSRDNAADALRRAIQQGSIAATPDSQTGFAALGGLQAQKRALQELVVLPLQAPHLFAQFGLKPPRGVLLWGPPGTGKSRLARAAAQAASAALLVVNGPDLLSAVYGESEAALKAVFAAASSLAPAVIFIDEADAMAASRSAGDDSSAHAATGAAGEASARVVASLLTAMDALQGACRVVVIAATNRPEALDTALRRPGRFDREVEVGVPSPADRAEILRAKLGGMKHGLSSEDISRVAAQAHGCVGADLAAMCTRAGFLALHRLVQQPSPSTPAAQPCSIQVTAADLQQAQSQTRPSALREVAVEVPHAGWADVGGLEEVKQKLQEAVQWPIVHPEALARLGAKAPRGVLLMGPPGCSKTLLARAVAAEAKLNFLAVKGPELLSKWVGASEQAVAKLFARARAVAPAIVFFDELDGLAGSRDADSASSSGVGGRVIAQLLAEMDGLQGRQGVVVLAATNRPDRLDAALLRPGRFDRLLYVPLPDAAARAAILQVHTRSTPLLRDVDLASLAHTAHGYSGADLAAMVRRAALAALEEDMGMPAIAARHFAIALKESEPSPTPGADVLALYRHYERH